MEVFLQCHQLVEGALLFDPSVSHDKDLVIPAHEAFFEGIFLWIVIWFIIRPVAKRLSSNMGPGIVTGSYFIGYGLVRFVIEYFREPDSQLGFIIALGKETEPTALFRSALNISLGQILCLAMIAAGIAIIIIARKTEPVSYKRKGKGNANANRRKGGKTQK